LAIPESPLLENPACCDVTPNENKLEAQLPQRKSAAVISNAHGQVMVVKGRVPRFNLLSR